MRKKPTQQIVALHGSQHWGEDSHEREAGALKWKVALGNATLAQPGAGADTPPPPRKLCTRLRAGTSFSWRVPPLTAELKYAHV